MRDKSEIERAITAFVRRANGGLIITGGSSVTPHRDLIIELAAQLRLPRFIRSATMSLAVA